MYIALGGGALGLRIEGSAGLGFRVFEGIYKGSLGFCRLCKAGCKRPKYVILDSLLAPYTLRTT